jgi:hypothetical protein
VCKVIDGHGQVIGTRGFENSDGIGRLVLMHQDESANGWSGDMLDVEIVREFMAHVVGDFLDLREIAIERQRHGGRGTVDAIVGLAKQGRDSLA